MENGVRVELSTKSLLSIAKSARKSQKTYTEILLLSALNMLSVLSDRFKQVKTRKGAFM